MTDATTVTVRFVFTRLVDAFGITYRVAVGGDDIGLVYATGGKWRAAGVPGNHPTRKAAALALYADRR